MEDAVAVRELKGSKMQVNRNNMKDEGIEVVRVGRRHGRDAGTLGKIEMRRRETPVDDGLEEAKDGTEKYGLD